MGEENELNVNHGTQPDTVFLATAGDSIEADMLEARLRENDIPVLRRYRESGDYLNVIMGKTTFGIDLYVPQDRLEEAKGLIETDTDVADEEILSDPSFSDESVEEANDAFLEKLDRQAKWMGIAFLVAIIILVYLIIRM